MKLYRVETKAQGAGPFQGQTSGGMDARLPTPHEDKGFSDDFVVNQRKHRFGCGSKKMMNSWIRNASFLKDSGFVVSLYHVEKKHIVRGKFQIVFDKKKAKIVDQFDIVSFKKNKLVSLKDI